MALSGVDRRLLVPPCRSSPTGPTPAGPAAVACWLLLALLLPESALTAPGEACADATAEQVFTSAQMVGCGGTVAFANRASLCGPGWKVCTAHQWVALRGADVPTHHYWTADDLLFGPAAGDTGNCFASLTTGDTSCSLDGTPMRVCAPDVVVPSVDPLGNECNWTRCGFDAVTPIEHFGGCAGNATAGALCCPGAAQAFPAGGELQINTYTTGGQRRPAVATGPDGDFVVVWSGEGDGDASYYSIRGQRYGSNGSAIGAEFQINTFNTGTQYSTSLATDADGNFVVVWNSRYLDGSYGSVQGQRFASNGSAIGGEFQINTYTTSFQRFPTVVTDADGDFVVVWDSFNQDGSFGSIQGQRYASDGATIGGEFQINTYTTAAQYFPAIATEADGDFIVVWNSRNQDGSGDSIQGQRYASDGATIGGEFQINTYTTGNQYYSAVAIDTDGNFVVVWESNGPDGSDNGVRGQRYASNGSAIGGEFQINTYTTGRQFLPAVATDAAGDFVVVWNSRNQDGSGDSIQGQRYTSNGTTIGSEFQINTYTTSGQRFPAVATDADGDFVVVWESSSQDGDSYSIQGQRYEVGGIIGNRVWRDLDLDGLQDTSEPGLQDVTVHLFDDFGALLSSTATNVHGIYTFDSRRGPRYLQFELPRDLSFTIINRLEDDTVDSDADVLRGTTDTFAVLAKSALFDWDAGMANGLGDFVWLDVDGDGFQDPGELGVGGVTVSLYDELGALLDTAVTDGDGFYSFQDLAPDRYVLGVTLPAGAVATLPDQRDDRFDSDIDAQTALSVPIDLARGELDTSWDAGLITSVALGDRVWLDDDGNGIQDGGESGASGVTVNLRDSGGGLVATTASDGSGFFGFSPAPGSYYLEAVLPPGFAFTQRDQGTSDGADSDMNPTSGTTILFILGAGGPDLSWDAGLEPAVLGNQVWLDRNGNGLQDAGEPGVAGITVRLLSDLGAVLGTETTDADGRYAFAGLASASYELEFAPPAGYAFTARRQGSDALRDSDAGLATGRTGLIAYAAASAERSFDAGLLEIPIFVDGFESGDLTAWASSVP